jgi:FtsP/CotA-like multicopper oxidase with cupredoxin domain
VIDDPDEAKDYDQDFVLVLEDWVTRDGGGPEATRHKPVGGMMHGGGGMMRGGGMMNRQWGRNAGEPRGEPVYDAYAVNGRAYPHTQALQVKEGQRIRLRICNASASTIYDLRLAGHALTITHSDGQASSLSPPMCCASVWGNAMMCMIVADNPGNWLLGAYDSGWGESGLKLPVVYAGHQDKPPEHRNSPGACAIQTTGISRRQSLWRPARVKPGAGITRCFPAACTQLYGPLTAIPIPSPKILKADPGQTIRFSYTNHSHMAHPMHLHGHFFRVVNPDLPPERWIMKDTVIVDPMRRVDIQFLADNPGRWLHHCHHLYHMEAGMANLLQVA